MSDQFLEIAKTHDSALELKYNKFYIGLAKDANPRNFVIFRPKKGSLRFEPRLNNSPETHEKLESAGLDVMGYHSRWGRYRIRLQPGDIQKNKEVLAEVISEAYAASGQE